MSLKSKRSAPVEIDAECWLAQHHPDTLEHYNQLFKNHRGDTDAVLRALSDNDLDSLIDALDPERRAERIRWNGVIERIRPLVSDSEFTTVAEHLRDQFLLDATAWRWPVVTLAWLTACPLALRGAAIAALNGNQSSGPNPWLHVWLTGLARIESRLPPDIAPGCVEVLVQAQIANAATGEFKIWYEVRTCETCGLLRPASLATCPHCVSANCASEGQQPAQRHDWRGLAESELASFDWGTKAA